MITILVEINVKNKKVCKYFLLTHRFFSPLLRQELSTTIILSLSSLDI